MDKIYETVFNSVNDGILIITLDGRFLEVNQITCDDLGYQRHELLQMTVMDITPPEFREMARENVIGKMKQGGGIVETISICKDGSLVPIELNIHPIEYNGAPAILAVARNITERKKAEEAMLSAKLAAEDANKSKSEFLANMSHELRTPLNSIIGFSDVISNESHGSLNELQKKFISNVISNGKHLLNIINDILSASQIETGKMELHISEFHVSESINEIEVLMIPIASEKNIELKFNIDIGMPNIRADATKFEQIIYNLVNNAIKFTNEGEKVEIRGEISDDFVHISVKDSGIGISPDDQNKLFTPFFQVDSSNTREYGGTGLGLAIVKKYVEMHGGKVWVESEVGKGSTFGFRMPTYPESTSSKIHCKG
ncbi:sensor histidine kinase [Methanococcoides burtonii]|uniref:histidine kinase n=1 Tax=Methanococcoides burtonii (strain DSM 6242 / NBRC 107633 / OCM 468 / ACE-M) TaxID=259564 RepID=Q12TH2_METBU|nr:ATP-binding protein [Methanococcoides burtonii]ABE53254.1 luxQ-like PAS sensor signal transduction histidine kinase [Methanococcoides burtonii DSM 6242]